MKLSLQSIALLAGITLFSCANQTKEKSTAEAKSATESCDGCTETVCCSSEQKAESTLAKVQEKEVQAYYFHGTRRCATCEAVEKVTQETLTEKYPEVVGFASINREEEKDHPLIEQFKISGQTLLIKKGEELIDLTNVAFLNARSNPEKLKQKIVETVEELIKK